VSGAVFTIVPALVRAAWGDDDWFLEEFLSMSPPPDMSDLRSVPGAPVLATSADPDDFDVGDAERIVRLSLSDFLTTYALLGR
jgi:hypothetical protein